MGDDDWQADRYLGQGDRVERTQDGSTATKIDHHSRQKRPADRADEEVRRKTLEAGQSEPSAR